jgi:hypothetical protein
MADFAVEEYAERPVWTPEVMHEHRVAALLDTEGELGGSFRPRVSQPAVLHNLMVPCRLCLRSKRRRAWRGRSRLLGFS